MACNACAGIGFWSLNKLSKMEKSTSICQWWIQKTQKRVARTLASHIETLSFSESSINIIQINFKETRPPSAHPKIRPYCCLLSQLLCYREEADEFVLFLQNCKICSFNKNKNYDIGQLHP